MTGTGALSPNLTLQLLEMHKARRGGIVRVEHGTVKKQLVVRNGLLAFAESNSPDEHLARVLVSLNLLPRAALAGIAAQMKEKKTSDEAILSASKLGLRELEEGAREQALRIVASLMEWDAGELRVYASEQMARRQYDLGMPLPDLLVAAARRASAKRPIPAIFRPLQGMIYPAMDKRDSLLTLPLDKTEASAFGMMQDPIRLEEILPLLAPDRGKPEDVILTLLMLGLACRQETKPAQVKAIEEESSPQAQRLEEMLRLAASATHYEILGVPADATDSQIKEAYHALAKQYHPDRFQSKRHGASLHAKAETLFARITGAYAALGNATSRTAYDVECLTRSSTARPGRGSPDAERESAAEGLFRSGAALLSKHEFEKAAAKLGECVYLRPEDAKYRYYLGFAQSEVPKMRKEAEQNLLKALELDPMRGDANLALAKLYLKIGMARRAEQRLREVLRLDPGNSEAESLLREVGTRK